MGDGVASGACSLEMAEEITQDTGVMAHISLESRICPVPLPLLSLATGLYGHKKDGQCRG